MRLLPFILLMIGVLALAPQARAGAAQEAGTPFIHNFSPLEMGAHPQTWSFAQDRRGVLYAGNGAGLLEYDGVSWRLLPTTRGTSVHGLALDGDGRLFIGAEDDIGILEPDAAGTRSFVSLRDRLDLPDFHFSSVRRVLIHGGSVLFVAQEAVLEYRDGRVKTWKTPLPVYRAYEVGGTLYLQRVNGQLVRWDQGRELPVAGTQAFLPTQIMAMVPLGPDPAGPGPILVATRSHGLFLLDGKGARPFPSEVAQRLKSTQLIQAVALADGTLALGTGGAGVFVIDRLGRLQKVLGKATGLRDDVAAAIFQDRDGGIWFGFNNGIAHVEWPSRLTLHGAQTGLASFPWALARHQGVLYGATGEGVFYLDPSSGAGIGRFRPVTGIHGNCLDIVSTGRFLLATNPSGVFQIEGGQARLVWPSNRLPMALFSPREDPDLVLMGLEGGVASLRRRGRDWVFEGELPGLPFDVFYATEPRPREIWFATRNQGLVRARFPAAGGHGAPVVTRFGLQEGLPSETLVEVAGVGGRILAATRSGFYTLDEQRDRFQPDLALARLFPGETRAVEVLRLGRDGRAWCYSHDDTRKTREAGALVPGPAGYHWESEPFRRFSQFDMADILADPDGVVWFSTTYGLVRFDPQVPVSLHSAPEALIRRVVTSREQILYGGGLGRFGQPAPRLPYAAGFLRFEFAAPSFDLEADNLFQVRIDGRDADWSSWTREPFKEYTSLPPGSYCFRVRARNVYGLIGPDQAYPFRILPPWYRTWWADLGGLALAALGLTALFLARTRILEQRNQALEKRIAGATFELVDLNRRLSHLNTQKNHFMGIAAHDLRSPLSGIILSAELLESVATTDEVGDLARMIQSEGVRMSDILGRFLDVTAIEEGSIKAEPEPFSLTDVTQLMARRNAPVAHRKGITIQFESSGASPLVFADLRFTQAILANLLSNALKFSPPNSVVNLTVTAAGPRVLLAVADQGPGLTAEDMDNLYERFTKLSARPTGGEASTGLGLSIVKLMVDAMDCQIRVSSEPGKGATFVVEFPVPGPAFVC